MTREEIVKNLLTELIDMIDNGSQRDLDRADEISKTIIEALSQEPCTVSVSEKEPNEISEEVTLRFFKNSLKVRWHDFVIYNVEWLKKNWQMEMDIVCGVKPCDDAIDREFLFKVLDDFCGHDRTATITLDTLADLVYDMPSVTQKSGKWIPVSERLPEEYGEYLITWKNPKYPKTYIGICECEITDVYDHKHNRFEVEWLFDGYITTAYPDSYVVAWQPLPEPYQKGGKE